MESMERVACGHAFCSGCLVRWCQLRASGANFSCPTCRAPCPVASVLETVPTMLEWLCLAKAPMGSAADSNPLATAFPTVLDVAKPMLRALRIYTMADVLPPTGMAILQVLGPTSTWQLHPFMQHLAAGDDVAARFITICSVHVAALRDVTPVESVSVDGQFSTTTRLAEMFIDAGATAEGISHAREARICATVPLWLQRDGTESVPVFVAKDTMPKPADTWPDRDHRKKTNQQWNATEIKVLAVQGGDVQKEKEAPLYLTEAEALAVLQIVEADNDELYSEEEPPLWSPPGLDTQVWGLPLNMEKARAVYAEQLANLQSSTIWALLLDQLATIVCEGISSQNLDMRWLATLACYSALSAQAGNDRGAEALGISRADATQVSGRLLNKHVPYWLETGLQHRLKRTSREGLSLFDSIWVSFRKLNVDDIKALKGGAKIVALLMEKYSKLCLVVCKYALNRSSIVHIDCSSEQSLLLAAHSFGRVPFLTWQDVMVKSRNKEHNFQPHPIAKVCHNRLLNLLSSSSSSLIVHSFLCLSLQWDKLVVAWGRTPPKGAHIPKDATFPSDTANRLHSLFGVMLGCDTDQIVTAAFGDAAQGKSPIPNNFNRSWSAAAVETEFLRLIRQAASLLARGTPFHELVGAGLLRPVFPDLVRTQTTQASDLVFLASLVYKYTKQQGVAGHARQMAYHVCDPPTDWNATVAFPLDVASRYPCLVRAGGRFVQPPPARLWVAGMQPRWPTDAMWLYELCHWWGGARLPKLQWEACCSEQAALHQLPESEYVKVMQGLVSLQEAKDRAGTYMRTQSQRKRLKQRQPQAAQAAAARRRGGAAAPE